MERHAARRSLRADRARLRPQPDRAVRRAGRGTLGSSKPAYGMETIGGLIIRSQLQTGFSRYPRCGEIVCGVWPHIVSEGRLVVSTVMAQGGASGGDNPFPRAGTFAASEEFYHFGAYTIYQGFASDIEAGSKAAQGAKVYLRCSASTRCSTNAKGDAAE